MSTEIASLVRPTWSYRLQTDSCANQICPHCERNCLAFACVFHQCWHARSLLNKNWKPRKLNIALQHQNKTQNSTSRTSCFSSKDGTKKHRFVPKENCDRQRMAGPGYVWPIVLMPPPSKALDKVLWNSKDGFRYRKYIKLEDWNNTYTHRWASSPHNNDSLGLLPCHCE